MNRLGELVRNAAEVAVASNFRQCLESSDFEEDLDLVDGVAVRRVADAQAIPGERRITGIEGAINVTVFVVSE